VQPAVNASAMHASASSNSLSLSAHGHSHGSSAASTGAAASGPGLGSYFCPTVQSIDVGGTLYIHEYIIVKYRTDTV